MHQKGSAVDLHARAELPARMTATCVRRVERPSLHRISEVSGESTLNHLTQRDTWPRAHEEPGSHR